MRILTALTYYHPHVSGLTEYAARLSRALVKRGHSVTILTSQYDRELPEFENIDGVNIERIPVLFRVSKGVIMPTIGFAANRLVPSHDALLLHLPQFDAAGISLRGRILGKPTIVTYHCDLKMPSGLISQTANVLINLINQLTARITQGFVTNTLDYAQNSRFLQPFLQKVHEIPPPIQPAECSKEEISAFSKKYNHHGNRPVIGLLSRFASEKGIEVFLRAFPKILEHYPDAMVLYAGPYKNIIGEKSYYNRLFPGIEELIQAGKWFFCGNGKLSENEIRAFYKNLDVFVFPSLNQTESFGIVQVEAMMAGVPVAVSNIPGVRQPVLRHKMGELFEVGNDMALAQAVIKILENREEYSCDSDHLLQQYSPDECARKYEELLEQLLVNKG